MTIARNLKDKLESLPGVLEVEIGGDREEIVEILIDAGSIEAYGLSPNSIIGLVSSNSQLVTAGAMEQSGGRMVIKVPAVIETLDELMNMPIKASDDSSIKFSDIPEIAVAQAAVPQAAVKPAPLSHTFTFTCFLFFIVPKVTLHFSGK